LEDLQALLQLRRENLLLRECLRLREAGHVLRIEAVSRCASSIPASFLFILWMAQGIELASMQSMNPKSLAVVALAGTAFASALLAPLRSSGQAAGDDPALTAILTAVTAQQATLAENQAKIDLKLAGIGENLRLARIYVGRGGGKTP